ncbi:MAG: RIP metalloprotease RseP [Alphaproteobacteria bacterium]|nr:RIP metalloprotease RseP [Alphaproteobacteria bacterium]
MNFFELIQMVGENIWIYGGSLILVLSILVFVHEWGHYIVARMCGVRVEKFSIGFGKEIYGFNDKAGTRWKISMIPLGGFVQLFGDTNPASAGHSDTLEDGDEVREMTEEELKVAFFTKKVWQRALIVLAGPGINYLFAIALLAGLYVTHGQPVSPPTAAAVMEGSNAEKYGFKPHDLILTIDGKGIEDFSDIRREMMVALDEERHFVVKRGGETIEITARPKKVTMTDKFGFSNSIGILGLIGAEKGILIKSIKSIDGVEYDNKQQVLEELKTRMDTTFIIGLKTKESGGNEDSGDSSVADQINDATIIDSLIVAPLTDKNPELWQTEDIGEEVLYLSNLQPEKFVSHTMMTAVQSAINESYVMTVSSLQALWQIVVGTRSATELGGIVRIGAITGETAMQGIIPLILLTALLSINLGFINLLPIPMLDGGHLLFYGIESIIGKAVPEYIQEYSFRAGFVFLIGIMAFTNLNDIYQLIT